MWDKLNFGNFSVRGYLPLIQKDSITHMHDLAVNMKEGLSQDLSLENSVDSFMFLTGFASLSDSLLFPVLITFFVFIHGLWFYFI